jgi:hypothetical protein
VPLCACVFNGGTVEESFTSHHCKKNKKKRREARAFFFCSLFCKEKHASISRREEWSEWRKAKHGWSFSLLMLRWRFICMTCMCGLGVRFFFFFALLLTHGGGLDWPQSALQNTFFLERECVALHTLPFLRSLSFLLCGDCSSLKLGASLCLLTEADFVSLLFFLLPPYTCCSKQLPSRRCLAAVLLGYFLCFSLLSFLHAVELRVGFLPPPSLRNDRETRQESGRHNTPRNCSRLLK